MEKGKKAKKQYKRVGKMNKGKRTWKKAQGIRRGTRNMANGQMGK